MPRGPFVIEPLERRAMLTVAGGGFTQQLAALGLREPTDMVVGFTRNPDIFITERAGRVRLYHDHTLVQQAMAFLQVDTSGERGVLGITIDPKFELHQHYLYISYVTPSPNPHIRVSRFLVNGQTLAMDFEKVLLDLPVWNADQNGTGLTHLGGNLGFGYDGTLYFAVGDSGRKENASDLEQPFGKILRLKPDGTVPADNPFAGAGGWKQYVWASGFQAPKLAIHPENGIVYVNDLGTTQFEEINRVAGGADYGWPYGEGPNAGAAPMVSIPHQQTDPAVAAGGRISGGTIFSPGTLTFPVPFGGDYFFADRATNVIQVVDIVRLQAGETNLFATDIIAPIELGTTPDGDLLCLAAGDGNGDTGQIIRFKANGTPAIVHQPRGGSAASGTTFTFTVAVAGVEPFTYQWQRNGIDIPGATGDSYTTGSVATTDDGAIFTVIVTNELGSTTSLPATLHVTAAGVDPGTGGGGNSGGGGGSNGGGGGSGGGGHSPNPGGNHQPPPPMGPIDLVPDAAGVLPVTAFGGTTGRYSVRVYNLGLDTARGALTLRMSLSSDSVKDAGDFFVGDVVKNIRIAPGASKVIRLKVPFPLAASGDAYHLAVQLDPANTLPETDETNNVIVTGELVTLVPPIVDIQSALDATPTSIAAGQTATLQLTVANVGNIAAGGVLTMVISLSPGTDLVGASGTAAGGALSTASAVYSRTIKLKLAPGKTKRLKLKFTLPSELTSGSYSWVASADTANAVQESDETNNSAVATMPVVVQ